MNKPLLDLCFVCKFFIGLCAVVGHEISGVVSKVGPNVKDIHIGDHVGVGYFIDACLNCEYCNNDQENNCVKGIVTVDTNIFYTFPPFYDVFDEN